MKTLLLGVLIALLLTAVAAAKGLSPHIRDDMAVGRHPTTTGGGPAGGEFRWAIRKQED